MGKGLATLPTVNFGSYVRQAYLDGLGMEEEGKTLTNLEW